MNIGWTEHAQQRFFERSLKYGLNYAEIDEQILKQKIKIKQSKNKIKTIFKVLDYYFTVIKEETSRAIYVVSIWESNDEEVKLWKTK